MASGAATGRQRYQWLLVLVAAALLVAWLLTGGGEDDSTGGTATDTSSSSLNTPSSEPDGGLATVQLADLPPEAARTLGLIDDGGPFPEDRDGVTFENREDLLPDQPMGYYREYTVPTPGSDDRGARRIVTGEAGELYWTDDHYGSFSRIERST